MPILTIKEVANKYRVSIMTVHNWIKKGLPVTRIGRVIRVDEKKLEEFISAQNSGDSSAQTGGDAENK